MAVLKACGFKLSFFFFCLVAAFFLALYIVLCILKTCPLFFPHVCSSDFITCKTLMPGGTPLLSSVLKTGAVTGLRGTSQGGSPLSVPRRLCRAMLQPNLPLQDKKPGQDSHLYQWISPAAKQKPTGIKILSFALPFLAFHFLLHWGFLWE